MSRLSLDGKLNGESVQMLSDLEKSFEKVPNFFKVVAQSSNVLSGFLAFSDALKKGVLSAKEREQIALTVAGFDKCAYCAAAHTVFARNEGVSDQEIENNIKGKSESNRSVRLIKFCLVILDKKGSVSDDEMASVREVGFSDEAIIEIVAIVAMNIFTNYFNHVAQTDLDFPRVDV